ncbi:MAG: TonB-dependent receptor [Steroidobacteraceae bacterium]
MAYRLRSNGVARQVDWQIWRRPLLALTTVALTTMTWTAQAKDSDALKKLSVEQLMDVEVTSVSRRPEKLSESASAIQVITQDDIRRSGASSLPEALRLASNLEVAQIDSRQWAISARGFNSTTANKLLVLIDGRTVYTPLYAGVFWDAQDTLMEDIEQIEVISGPGATLWGANAVNGVINITTKNSRDTQGGIVTAGGGDELRKFGGVRYGGNWQDQVDYRVYAKYFDRDDALLANGNDATNTWRMVQGGWRADATLTNNDTLTVQGDMYQGAIRQLNLDDIAISGGNVLGRWTRNLSDTSDLQLQTYFDRTHRRIPGSYAESLDTMDVDFQHRFMLSERHELIWGGNYRHISDEIGNAGTFSFTPNNINRQWFGLFVQDGIDLLTDTLSLTLGAKLEHNEYTGYEFLPSTRLAWRIDERSTAWAAISRATRSPSRIDSELVAPANPPYTVVVPNSDFESEKLMAYELGYRALPITDLSVSLSLFYNDYDDVRSIEHVTPGVAFPVYIGNGLTAIAYGAELSSDYNVTDKWRLRLGYTDMRLQLRRQPGSTDTSNGSSEAHDPKHQLLLRSSHDLTDNIELDATFRYVSKIIDIDVPGYSELDFRVGWQLTDNIELSLAGRNLLHAHHAEFGSAATRQEIERNVYGKFTWEF